MNHPIVTEIDKRTIRDKTVSLVQYSTQDGSSVFWRVVVSRKGQGTSIPFDCVSVARSVFRSHINF